MIAHPYGESAVLVEVPATRSPAAVALAISARAGIVDAVPGARTVLIEYDPTLWTTDSVCAALDDAGADDIHDGRHVDIRVRYDGPDLEEVAGLTGMTTDEVISRHLAGAYTVAFCGFVPGFAYLAGLDPSLHVSRRAEPRASVPAGAVAIAGEYSAVYPRSTPGGWRLLGRADVTLWDIDHDPPALLVPGTTVRFVAA